MTKPKIELLPAQRRAVLQRILAVSAAAMLPAVSVRAQQQDVSKDYSMGIPAVCPTMAMPRYTAKTDVDVTN